MDQLQAWMESNYHLDHAEEVYEHTLNISKFWSVLTEEDREYIQCAQDAYRRIYFHGEIQIRMTRGP